MQTLRSNEPAPAVLTPARSPGLCLNCGAPLDGSFCPDCGQRNIPPYPSLRELATDAFAELAGWDGRIASTLRSLIARPGVLTREFLEGRRARYISPFRLYLLASVAFFVLSAAAPDVKTSSGNQVFVGIRPLPDTSARPGRTAAAAEASMRDPTGMTAEERAEVLRQLDSVPALVRPLMRQAVEDPRGFKRDMFEAMPRMLFVLLPLFAGIVALFYHGRKYPEHLYFSIHVHAFIFSALALIELLKFTRVTQVVIVGSLVCFVWIPVYATLALRRVYGGSVIATLAKELGIGAIYLVTWSVVFMGTVFLVAL